MQLAREYLQKAIVFSEDSCIYSETVRYGKKALLTASKTDDYKIMTEAAMYIGMGFTFTGDKSDSALYYLHLAKKYSEKYKLTDLGMKIRLEQCNFYVFEGEIDLAAEEIYELLIYFEKKPDVVYQAKTHLIISKILFSRKRIDEAIEQSSKATKLFLSVHEPIKASYSELRTAHYFSSKQEFDQAENLYKKAFKTYSNLRQGYGKFKYQDGLTILYANMGRFDESLELCKQALLYTESKNLFTETQDLIRRIGYLNLAKGDVNEAKKYAKRIEAFMEADKSNSANYYNYLFLSEVYLAENNYKTAFEYQSKYYASKDSMVSVSTERKIEELKTRYETEKKDKQILENKHRIDQLNKQKESAEFRFYRSVFLFISMALIILLLGTFYLNKTKREKEMLSYQKELFEAETKKKIKALEIQILYAQMNPHFVFNCLSAIQHLFLSGNSLEANSKLNSFSRLLRLSIDHVKRDFVTLKDEMAFLNNYIDLEQLQFDEPFRYQFINDCSESLEHLEIPSMILQPYVENAINHGLKNMSGNLERVLTCHLKETEDQLIISVADNGVGREMAGLIKSKSSHNHESRGLSLVQEKINAIRELYGIEISIQVEDLYNVNQSVGTKVSFSFPKDLDEE